MALTTKQTDLLLGRTVEVESRDEARKLLAFLFDSICVDNAEAEAIKTVGQATAYSKPDAIKAIGFGFICGMNMVHLALETEEEDFDLLNENGTFCFVYNADAPFCSEFGTCGFCEENGGIVRAW